MLLFGSAEDRVRQGWQDIVTEVAGRPVMKTFL